MYTKKAKDVNPLGIHGRAASVFTHTASQFSSHVFVERADDSMKKANAKSVVFVLALCLAQNDEIILSADGPDEKEAVEALIECLKTLDQAE